VRHAAAHDPGVPWFAIGGIDEHTVGEVVAAGARRIVVVRAITEAPDPERAARALRAALDRGGLRGAA
jgi:thiamine-phosphate pyrophosphorylase